MQRLVVHRSTGGLNIDGSNLHSRQPGTVVLAPANRWRCPWCVQWTLADPNGSRRPSWCPNRTVKTISEPSLNAAFCVQKRSTFQVARGKNLVKKIVSRSVAWGSESALKADEYRRASYPHTTRHQPDRQPALPWTLPPQKIVATDATDGGCSPRPADSTDLVVTSW